METAIRDVAVRFAGSSPAGFPVGSREADRAVRSFAAFAWNGFPRSARPARCRCLFSNPGRWRAGRDQKSPLRRCFKPRPSKHPGIFPGSSPSDRLRPQARANLGKPRRMPESFPIQEFFRAGREKKSCALVRAIGEQGAWAGGTRPHSSGAHPKVHVAMRRRRHRRRAAGPPQGPSTRAPTRRPSGDIPFPGAGACRSRGSSSAPTRPWASRSTPSRSSSTGRDRFHGRPSTRSRPRAR